MDEPKTSNEKLESFMKRNLPSIDFSQIRCYERCIVDKAIRLALLTSRNLIITDSPPRIIHYTLNLEDVLSFELVQDLPDFLDNTNKLKTQHILLKLRCDTKPTLTKSMSSSSFVSQSSEGSSDVSPSNSGSGASLRNTLWQDRFRGKSSRHLGDGDSLSVDRLSLSDNGSASSRSWSEPCAVSELHLLLLTDSSLFFKLLQAATLNDKIAATKRLNFSDTDSPVFSPPRRHKKSVVQARLYNQLSSEICTSPSLEDRFLLVKELHTAATLNPPVKRFFWKDVDLCKELVRETLKYRRHNKNNNRADELEYLILLESCLAEMFRESEHHPKRCQLFAANSHYFLNLLLESIASPVQIPCYLDLDTEVDSLRGELLDNTTALLFEVLVAVTEHPRHGADVTLSHVVGQLENLAPSFLQVLNAMIEKGLSLVSRTTSAYQTLYIYQIFFTVDCICKASATLGSAVKSRFAEDIKYYCSNPASRIVRYSPLQSLAISRVASVTGWISKK